MLASLAGTLHASARLRADQRMHQALGQPRSTRSSLQAAAHDTGGLLIPAISLPSDLCPIHAIRLVDQASAIDRGSGDRRGAVPQRWRAV
jgi:hypothetical protein